MPFCSEVFGLVVCTGNVTFQKKVTSSNVNVLCGKTIDIPSKELTYPTWGKGTSSTQKCLDVGYVSFDEGILGYETPLRMPVAALKVN